MEFKDINSFENLESFLQYKGRRHHNYRHYATMDSIYGILKSGFLWLSRGDQMNDKHELQKGDPKEWEKIYVCSFAFGKSENLAMWGLYGQPHDEAALISFPNFEFARWISKVDEIYDPNNSYAKIDCKFTISLNDVVYIGGQRNSNDAILKWNDNRLDINNLFEEDDFTQISESGILTGFIKNYAWSYENEVRIRVKLENKSDMKRIAIKIPESLFNRTNNQSKVTLMYGPWCDNDVYAQRKIDIFENAVRRDICQRFKFDLLDCTRSGFKNLVEYREVCQCCELFDKNNKRIKRYKSVLFNE